MKSLAKLKHIKGDASFRRFYRHQENNSILVLSKKEKLKNLLIYDAINKILIKNKILAPNLLSENYLNNYIEIQDFGDQTVFKILKNKKNNKINTFKEILKILNKIQLIKDKKIKNFKNKFYKVQEYNNKILFDEAKLFCDWYVPKLLPKVKSIKFNKKFKSEVKNLLSKLNYKNDTFVHKDFHVSNLMNYKNQLAMRGTYVANPLVTGAASVIPGYLLNEAADHGMDMFEHGVMDPLARRVRGGDTDLEASLRQYGYDPSKHNIEPRRTVDAPLQNVPFRKVLLTNNIVSPIVNSIAPWLTEIGGREEIPITRVRGLPGVLRNIAMPK